MKKSNNYVGIDISKLNFDVVICNSENNYKYFKFANKHDRFIMFLELLNASEYVTAGIRLCPPQQTIILKKSCSF
jgi:transposase